jgi:NAD(P)-dependent dehydrogenase (short-subunit alcohol dehydrogenase family)
VMLHTCVYYKWETLTVTSQNGHSYHNHITIAEARGHVVTIGAQWVAGKVTRIVFYGDSHGDGTRSCRSLSPETYQQMAALHPMQRMGKPEAIAAAVLWLDSEVASFVTGHVLLAY